MDIAGRLSWAEILDRRRRFIELLIVSNSDEQIRRCLEVARERSYEIKPGLCQRFIESWEADLERWREFLSWLPVTDNPEKFLHEVNLTDYVRFSEAYWRRSPG
ncbi:hypothetical protein ACQP2E_10440 [Actinoplanes sp. CA-015351]|uniref:hypothetical protein n=1 Tax=Actinoplanes sp. CA-015351 TaxID=3239897 RepID=UPI003D95AD2B